jgi:hypothetical protein
MGRYLGFPAFPQLCHVDRTRALEIRSNGANSLLKLRPEGQGFNPATKVSFKGPFRSAEGWSEGAAGATELPSFAVAKQAVSATDTYLVSLGSVLISLSLVASYRVT